MPGQREYPPAPIVHAPECPEVPPPLQGLVQPTRAIAEKYPNAWQHRCFHFTINPYGIVAPCIYPAHGHQASSRWPNDAPVPTCEVCAGTHPGEKRSSFRIPAPRGVILPGGF